MILVFKSNENENNGSYKGELYIPSIRGGLRTTLFYNNPVSILIIYPI